MIDRGDLAGSIGRAQAPAQSPEATGLQGETLQADLSHQQRDEHILTSQHRFLFGDRRIPHPSERV